MMTSSNGNIFPGEFPAQRPVARSFDVSFDLRLNKRLSEQSWGWWFETLSRPLWRHCNDIRIEVLYRRNQGYWWLTEFDEFPSMLQKINRNGSSRKMKTSRLSGDQCTVSDEIFRAIGKRLKTKIERCMDQIGKPDINGISSSYVHKNSN